MKIIIPFIVFCSIVSFSNAQNLVVNPSFEITNTNCANFGGEGFRQDLDPSWDNANSNIPGDSCSSPDLFSACNTIFGAPGPTFMPDATSFGIGWQYSRTGTRHAGFILYSAPFGFADSYREYIQGHTSTPMVAGTTYCISFYVSLADGCPYATENIQVYFTNNHYLRDACTQGSLINVTPQLENSCGVISDTMNWVRMQWDYVATGGEQYFIIGNFDNDAGTTTAPANGTGFGNDFAYYFIDDVSIVATSCCHADITDPGIFCTSQAATNLTATGGIGSVCTAVTGTWSGTGITNTSSGTFNPAIAGVGTHTISFTLPCGYVATMDITVSACTPLAVCLETNGDFTVSGGTATYEWSEWLPGGTTPITNEAECLSCNSSYTWNAFTSCMDGFMSVDECVLTAGYYPLGTGTTITPGTNFPIQVEDAQGQTFTINSSGELSPCTSCPTITVSTASQVNVNCFGQSTGSFSASSSGGTGPYDYTLLLGPSTIATFNDVAGSQAFTNLAAGTYTLNVTDNGGCTGTTSITITENPIITITQTSITPASCGASNGSVTVSGSGGSGTINYSWNTNPVQTGATATGLAAGPYIVTATDALGCSQTLNVTMTSSGGISASIINPVNPTCNNGTNGTATASVTGGTGTINYSWSPSGGSAATGTGLSGGILYTVTVTDANSCSATATVTLTNPTAITVTTSSTDATCGASDGSLSASGSGGTGTLDYSWNTSPVQNTANASGVPSGTYTVTVTDDNGCTATANESVNNTGAPNITLVSQTDLDCNGDTDGTATVSASGGTGTLTITWNTSPAQTGVTATNLGGGTFIATVTDASGCSASLNVTIVEPTVVTGVATSTNSSCSASTGTATVVASGGDGSYTYLWSNNGVTSTISNLASGIYSVIITDGNGCTGTASTSVSTVTAANIDAGIDVIIVSGSSTTLTATGGITYVWTPSDSLSCTNCSNPIANPSETTTYYVTGTDVNGCVGTDSVRVIVEDPCGEVWVPTAFSPNGDGSNEQICVYGGCIMSLTFQLFDRWGNMVFETNDNTICWDGIYKDKPMNTAVFAYYLYVVLDNGDVVEQKGNITLVR